MRGSKFGKQIGARAMVEAVDEEGAGAIYHIFLASLFGRVVSGRPMSLLWLGPGCYHSCFQTSIKALTTS